MWFSCVIIENKTKPDMQNIYTKKQKQCNLVKAKPETVQFLLGFSKSLKIIEVNGNKFESNLN